MPASFKRGIDKDIEHFFRFAIPHKSGGNANNVGVVVFACQFGYFFAPANGGPYALVFVGGNGHTVGAAAEQDSKRGFPSLHGQSYRMGKVGIIHGIFAKSAKVSECLFSTLKKGNEGFLAVKSGVVASYGYWFCAVEVVHDDAFYDE
jgi:hypothetical protein